MRWYFARCEEMGTGSVWCAAIGVASATPAARKITEARRRMPPSPLDLEDVESPVPPDRPQSVGYGWPFFQCARIAHEITRAAGRHVREGRVGDVTRGGPAGAMHEVQIDV